MAHPELYKVWIEEQRRANEDLKDVEKQYEATKALMSTIDGTLDQLLQQQVSLRERAERAAAEDAAWAAAEATPFQT